LVAGKSINLTQGFWAKSGSAFTAQIIPSNLSATSLSKRNSYDLSDDKDSLNCSTGVGTFHVNQNSPNPFNPSTTIIYALPKMDNDYRVDLVIYNSIGQVVKRFLYQKQLPGIHKIVWDGTDYSGISLPSGVYLAKLTANSYIKTIKMILSK
jgi:flagellar hook assembly protein FlgD